MKAREWREEILSAKNRLYKLLTSDALRRFMGLADFSINLREIMDEGKVLLVNLKQSKEYLSLEGARTFGALLVNEFFEAAMERRKDNRVRDPKPYYLYLDEFQNFVSLDIASMLAEVRKFGLFLVLAHQYFEQLDEDITAAALNNCQIKAVFGGLSADNATKMAKEMFIDQLDPMKVKVAIHQTKFWPEYRRDKVYNRSSSHGSSSGTSQSTASGSSSALSSSASSGMSYDGSYFTPDKWFAMTDGFTRSEVSTAGTTGGTSSMSGSSSSDSQSWSESDGEADIPIFFPVPFQELSSIQYHSLEEQLTQMAAALKKQFQRHCFVQIRQQDTQPLLVPFVEPVTTFMYDRRNLEIYMALQHKKQNALPASEVDRLLKEQEIALIQERQPSTTVLMSEVSASPDNQPGQQARILIWNRTSVPPTPPPCTPVPAPQPRKRGPKTDIENHNKVVAIVAGHGEAWTFDEHLIEICEKLDEQQVPVPKTWPSRSDGKSRTWSRAFANYPHLVVKAIKDRCKAAGESAK
ncbi:MAG: TraM recognition domain-containing protein [Nitrospirae bacterium]|nr:TraM recognition domain-containing protein [Nitrospirota bacterium]